MKSYLVLLRGINVGGKNKVPMVELKSSLEELGFSNVSTYIASGNVLLYSDKTDSAIQSQIEAALPTRFRLDSELIKVLVLSRQQMQSVIDNKPVGFGEDPSTYYSDVIFLMGISVEAALQAFAPRHGVDKIWPGNDVVYSQRLGAKRTQSRLGRIVGTPVYKSMTIRSWNTTVKLLELLQAREVD